MKEKKRISKIYNSKIFWAIISLILSLIIWSYVSSIDGSTMEKTFSGIEVQFMGENNLLSQKGLAITNIETTSVTVRVRGSRANIGKINASDIKAVIDVSKVTQPNDMSWTYEIVFPDNVDKSDITIVSRSPDTISFSVVKNAKKTIPIEGSFEGTIADGCVAEELVFDPETLVVEGPENVLLTIDHAWVSFGKDMEIDATYSANVEYTLLDKNGNSVSKSSLKLSSDTINVTQPILKTKELRLDVDIVNGGGITREDCKITIEPKAISVAADSRLIDDMSSIILGTINLSSFQSSYEQTFVIQLDEGMDNLTGETEAIVKVEIPDVKVRTFRVTNISCSNCSSGYTASIDTESVEVTLRSKDADALASIKTDDITVVADLSNFGSTTGKVMANGIVHVSGNSAVGAIGEVKVTVTIQKD
ncbi:MAG: CdaR family protein [Bacillota bacterium]|nr:CdaR family protein [Bacillota bacterium]